MLLELIIPNFFHYRKIGPFSENFLGVYSSIRTSQIIGRKCYICSIDYETPSMHPQTKDLLHWDSLISLKQITGRL